MSCVNENATMTCLGQYASAASKSRRRIWNLKMPGVPDGIDDVKVQVHLLPSGIWMVIVIAFELREMFRRWSVQGMCLCQEEDFHLLEKSRTPRRAYPVRPQSHRCTHCFCL